MIFIVNHRKMSINPKFSENRRKKERKQKMCSIKQYNANDRQSFQSPDLVGYPIYNNNKTIF